MHLGAHFAFVYLVDTTEAVKTAKGCRARGGGRGWGCGCVGALWVCPSPAARFCQAVGHASSAPRASLPLQRRLLLFKTLFLQ